MSVDRETALRGAEKLLRQGKLEAAIAQYVRLVEDDPSDWNTINRLGDLHVRAGHADRAVEQFARVADHLHTEGVLPKAVAIYTKVLRLRPDDEHALVRLSDASLQQGLLADAKQYLRQLADHRKARGDDAGAADGLIRMAALDDADGDAKMQAAGAAHTAGLTPQAIELLRAAATVFERRGESSRALEALTAAADLSPQDRDLRSTVARALVAAGDLERARPFLTAETVADDPDLLVAVGRAHVLAGQMVDGHSALMRALAIAPDREAAILQVATELVAAGRVDDGFACVEVVADAALFEADFQRAADALETFVLEHPTVAALLKLVDVYVDGGLDDRIAVVQRQLADAYAAGGQVDEARAIAEDLFFREPGDEHHVDRLRTILAAAGVDDIDAAIQQLRDTAALFDAAVVPGDPVIDATRVDGPAPHAPGHDPSAEIDLSDAFTGLSRPTAGASTGGGRGGHGERS